MPLDRIFTMGKPLKDHRIVLTQKTYCILYDGSANE